MAYKYKTMKTEKDVEFICDFDLENKEYRPFFDRLEKFDWNKDFLNRKDGLSSVGMSKVIFYDHFTAGEGYNSFNVMYGVDIDENSRTLRNLSYPILENILKKFPNSTYVKGEISCCFPFSEQRFHIDPRMFHRYSKRVHLPLTTNNDCFLDIEKNSFHLERGKLYEFNNLKLHRSKNLGTINRVHIIVDIIDLDTLTKCKKIFAERFYSKVNYLDNDFI